MDFNYHLPVNLIIGRGKHEEVGTVTMKQGKKALIAKNDGDINDYIFCR